MKQRAHPIVGISMRVQSIAITRRSLFCSF